MTSKSKGNHVIIFDTNILYETTDNRCNFTEFRFNKLFQNIIDEIESRDLIEFVSVAIPEVTWNEIYTQRLQSFYEKSNELKRLFTNFTFPNLHYEFDEIDYSMVLNEQINLFKRKLDNYSAKVFSLDLPSDERFSSIMERAFAKYPPFEGKSKKSDKGFKDALIWESIIEYKTCIPDSKITLYARDGLFNKVLSSEYSRLFDDEIQILNTEEKVIMFITDLHKSKIGLSESVPNVLEFYEEIKEILDSKFVDKALFDIEVKKEIGSDLYDISEVINFKVENIIEMTNSSETENLFFEVKASIDIVISNVEKGEDLSFISESFTLEVKYSQIEKVFYLHTVSILGNLYECDDYRIGGARYV